MPSMCSLQRHMFQALQALLRGDLRLGSLQEDIRHNQNRSEICACDGMITEKVWTG